MAKRGIKAFQVAKKDIINHFDGLKKDVFSIRDIEHSFNLYRQNWRLMSTLTVKDFLKLLLDETKFKEIKITCHSIKYTVYQWNENKYALALSLRKNSYLSHFTAMYIHDLTLQVPKSIYVNHELSPKQNIINNDLTQENIDSSFSKEQRKTPGIVINDTTYYLLNSKYNKNIGVIDAFFDNTKIRITTLERTLIDIIIRPSYSGDINEILDAYIAAKNKNVSVNKLCSYLHSFNHIYPYHQAIGFLLQRAGYSPAQYNLLKQFEFKYKFYLAYNMSNPAFCEEWNLYYPSHFKV